MDRLRAAFREVFDMPELEIDGLTRTNFPEWDSLAQVKLIIEIQEAFGLKLTIDQAAEISSVTDLRKLLQDKGTD